MTDKTNFDVMPTGAKNFQGKSDWEAWFACVAESETSGESLDALLFEGVGKDKRHPDLWAEIPPVGREIW